MKTLFCTWATTIKGSIGIGVVEDNHGKLSIRAAPVSGRSVEDDKKIIAEWGSRLVIDDLKCIISMVEADEK